MCPDSCELNERLDSDPNADQETRQYTVTDPASSTARPAEASAKPEISKFVVRLPADLLENLKRVSRHHNRSMNTEINLLLGRYIEQVKGESRPGVDEHVKLDSLLMQKISALPAQKLEALLDLLE